MQPWQARHARSAVLQQGLSRQPTVRARPLIYVYDMDTLFTSKMLQWRHVKNACTARYYAKCAFEATLPRLPAHARMSTTAVSLVTELCR